MKAGPRCAPKSTNDSHDDERTRFVAPLAVLKSLCIWGKQMLCLWSLSLCTVVSTSSRRPPPAARHVKGIHPTRLSADEDCLIDQGPINRLKKGRANEERDLPPPPRVLPESSRESDMPRCSEDVSGTAAGDKLPPLSTTVVYDPRVPAERFTLLCAVKTASKELPL